MALTSVNRGLATLLFDLLTERESEVDELTGKYRFDIALLSQRLEGAVSWLTRQPGLNQRVCPSLILLREPGFR